MDTRLSYAVRISVTEPPVLFLGHRCTPTYWNTELKQATTSAFHVFLNSPLINIARCPLMRK